MSAVDSLKAAIEALSEEDYAALRQWFSDKDWEKWDKQIETDSEAGRLDFLVKEAADGKYEGKLREL